MQEGRPFYKLKPLILHVTLMMLVFAVDMALIVIISWPIVQTLGKTVGLGESAVLGRNIAKWPGLAAFAVVFIAALYFGTSNGKQPRFRFPLS